MEIIQTANKGKYMNSLEKHHKRGKQMNEILREKKSTDHNEIQNSNNNLNQHDVVCFQAKTQNRPTQHAYEEKHTRQKLHTNIRKIDGTH
jgi:hypothetical protein